MTTKLYILLFATVLGAVITGCNKQPEENNPGAETSNVPLINTNLANTNSVGSMNAPTITTSNNVPMTNNPNSP